MKQPSDSPHAEGDEMAQVRDILFGSQFRELQRGLNELRAAQRDSQHAFVATIEQLRTALAEQRRALESAWGSQVQRLADQIRMEQTDRARGDQELRDELRSNASRLSEQAEDRYQQLLTQLEVQLKGLRRDERITLGQLFQHLSQQLREEETNAPAGEACNGAAPADPPSEHENLVDWNMGSR